MPMDSEDAQPATKGDLKSEIGATRADLKFEIAAARADLKSEVGAVRTDLKSEIAAVRAELKSEIAEVRTELKSEIREVQRSLSIQIVNTNARIDRLGEKFSTQLSEGVSKIFNVVDGFMAQTQKLDREQVITRYRVDELEKRVKTLEA